MKKILLIMLSVLMCLTFASCTNNKKTNTTEKDSLDSNTSKKPTKELKDMVYGICYIPSERYNFEENIDKDVELMANLGVGSVRIWAQFDCLLGSTKVDKTITEPIHKLIAKLQEKGITPILLNHVSLYKGENMKSKKFLRDTSKGSKYVSWLNEFYASYKTYAQEFSEVTYFEVGNELNNNDFMKDMNNNSITSMQDKVDISTDLLYYAARGIHAVNKDAKVVMGGITETDRLGGGANADFLEKIYTNINSGEFGYFYNLESKENASKDPDDYFQVVCWHPYPHGEQIDKESFIKRNNEIYNVVLKYEPEGKDVFFTEIGFSDNSHTYEENERAITTLFEAVKEMPYVKAVNYFKLFDSAQISWVGTYSRWGLFFDPNPYNLYDNIVEKGEEIPLNGAPKKMAYAFQEAAKGKGNLEMLVKK